MGILSLLAVWSGIVGAQTARALPEERKLSEWLTELRGKSSSEAEFEYNLCYLKKAAGLEAGDNPLLLMFDNGNLLAGLYLKLFASRYAGNLYGSEEAAK